MTCLLRAVMSVLAVLALHGGAASAGADPAATGSGGASDGAAGKRGPSTMSPAPGEPGQVDERPRLTIGQEVRRSNDHHTAYLGAAVVALGAMVWWNRRRRDRFEREDRRADARAAQIQPAPPAEHDDDADELRAAARGDGDNQ